MSRAVSQVSNTMAASSNGNCGEPSVEDLLNWFVKGNETNHTEIKGAASDYRKRQPVKNQPTSSLTTAHISDQLSYVEEYVTREDTDALRLLDKQRPSWKKAVSVSDVEAIEEMSHISEIPSINSLRNEEMDEIYSKYHFGCSSKPNSLPIYRLKNQILTSLDHNVIIIQGSTGSGKTTQVPQYILDHHAEMRKYCKIIVSQPRRLAAITVARRVCKERKSALGEVVGYQVGLDNHTSRDTCLTYVTTGVLLQKLVSQKNMNDYTHVILDEIHERDQDMDFCLLIVRKFLRTVSAQVKVILMSATFDVEKFGDYFAIPFFGKLEKPLSVSVDERLHDVQLYYLNHISNLCEKLPEIDISKPDISEDMYKLGVTLIKRFDHMDGEFRDDDDDIKRGSVLVFLPGLYEIEAMEKILQVDSTKYKWWLIPLHSTITVEEQETAFVLPERGVRKIILSTNIAESSVTIGDIVYVIDFCLTKNLVRDAETTFTSLQLEWASKANCVQRQGRAGRVGSGRVYRMIPEKHFQFLLEYNVPEMQRCPLEQVVLKTKVLDMGEPKAMLALALDPPKLSDIERTVLVLKELGALSVTSEGRFNPCDGDLLFMGRVLAQLPVDVHIGRLLVLGYIFGCLDECIIIGAGLTLKSFFAKPFKKILESYTNKMAWSHKTFSDFLAILNVYKIWRRCRENRSFQRPGGANEKSWGQTSFIQIRKIMEVERLVMELTKRLEFLNIRTTTSPIKTLSQHEETTILKFVLAGAFYPNYFVRRQPDEREIVRSLSGKDPLTTVVVNGLPLGAGVCYRSAILDVFERALINKRDKPKIKIHFEDSKAYVEFVRCQNTDSRQFTSSRDDVDQTNTILPILPEVYQAVKLRSLRDRLQIQELTKDSVEKCLEQLELVKKTGERTGKLRTNRITFVSGKIHPRVPLPSLDTTEIRILVTHVVECGHFWAFNNDDRTRSIFNEFGELINSEGTCHKPVQSAVVPGLICLAPYTTSGTTDYYRARVERVESVNSQNRVEVFFIDFGNVANVQKTDLKEINRELYPLLIETPAQAFECKLAEIKPCTQKGEDGVWSPDSHAKFYRWVYNKELLAQVYSVVQGVIRLILYDKDEIGRDININDELKDQHLAEAAEESYLSKQNHGLRSKAATEKTSVNDSGIRMEDPENDDWLVLPDRTHGDFFSYSRRMITLKGPYSPLEIVYGGLTRTGYMRAVKIEGDSVNSICLDPEPQDKALRMMVASSVNLNPSGNAIIARNTMLMPNIHDLPGLISMIFAPKAELRADARYTRYIGVVCGLGYDKRTKQPMYGEHDVEIEFDTLIDHSDILSINDIRVCIEMGMQQMAEAFVWAGNKIGGIQETLREKVLSLLERKRQQVERVSCRYPFTWCQVPQDRIYHIEKLNEAYERVSIDGIILQSELSSQMQNLNFNDAY